VSIVIEVARSLPFGAEVVWTELRQLDHHAAWMADAEAIEFDGPLTAGEGARFVAITRIGPVRTRDRMVVTQWEEGQAIEVDHVSLVRGHGRLSVSWQGPDRSQVRWREELAFPLGAAGEVVAHLVAPLLRWVWRGNLRRLEEIVAAGRYEEPPAS
jgi:hypothetical protein